MEIDLEFDKAHIWHPYTSMSDPIPAYPVSSACGVRLILEDGTVLIDGMSSWWAAVHGYNHPVINRALKDQVDQMSHVMFGGLTHEPAVSLSKRLVDITPPSLDKVFLADSGSVAVEVAVKMAFQYWLGKGMPGKNRLLTVKSGYHGDTFCAMSVCDPENGMHAMFRHVIRSQLFAPAPACGFYDRWDNSDGLAVEAIIREHHASIAAVIIEPVVQGAGGMRFYSPKYLVRLKELCERYDLLLIFDEIATGFGRTGKLFACEHAGVVPDIMCLGKALTGGYMTLAATLATDETARGVCQSESGVLMHGPTFMANPLACRAAVSSIDLLLSSDWKQRVRDIEAGLEKGLSGCRGMKGVRDVRVLGAIGVVEMDAPVNLEKIQRLFVKKGVWLRPFGRLVYTMPPYIISEKDLERLTAAVTEIVFETGRKHG